MRRQLRLFILLVAISVSPSCKFGNDKKDGQPDDTLNVESFEFKRGKKLDAKDWSCDALKEDVVCYPSNWKVIKQKSTDFFAYLDTANKDAFFAIAKYDMKLTKINTRVYLKTGYGQLLADTTEKFIGYTVKELIFNNKNTYYGEYYTSIGGQEYLSYSMVFEREGVLYDVILKVRRDRSPSYKQTFSNILFNLRIDGMLLFDENDNLEKIHIVDLSKI